MSSDSTKNITDLCRKIRDVSSTIRQNNSNSRILDIPDVLDITSNILTSIVPIKLSIDDSERKLKNQREKVDEIITQKERDFIKKMDQKIDTVAAKVNQMQQSMQSKEEKLSSCLTATQKLHSAEIVKVENEHEARIQQLDDEFKARKQELMDQERVAFAGFEKSLASHLSKISYDWNQKIQEVDDQIASYQKDLHDLIHNKHQQSQIKNEMLMNEDRRMASEHERISIEFRTRKEEANQKIKALTDEYQSIQDTLRITSQDGETRLIELEKKMLSERKEIEDQRNQEILDLKQKINSLASEASTKKLEIDGQRAAISVKVREIEKVYEQKFLTEENETKKTLEIELKKLEEYYSPKMNKLNISVQELDLKRAQKLEELRKEALIGAESGETEVNELKKRNEEEMTKFNELLKIEKENLNQTIQMKISDLEQFKQERQKLMSESLSKIDDEERSYNEQISNLMRQFGDQQKKLNDLQQLTLEQRDRRKADDLARIEQEHEKRMNQILLDVELQMRMDEEQKLNESLNSENEKHKSEVNSLMSMLFDIKGRMEALQSKMDDLYKMNNQKLQQIMEDGDQSLLEDLKKLKDVDSKSGKIKNKENIEELKSRILNETEEVRKRKYLVLQEVDELDKSIHDLHDGYEKKLQQIERTFKNTKIQIQKHQENVDLKKEKLTKIIDDQKEQINKLDELTFNKVEETVKLQNSYEDDKEAFKKETEEIYKFSLDEAEKESPLFEAQIEEIRNSLTKQIEELKRLLNESKEKTEKTVKLLLLEREQNLKEAELELRLISDEKKKQMKENHMKKINLLNEEFEENLKKHTEKVEELNRNCEEQYNLNENNFNDSLDKLFEEKKNLEETLEALELQIEALTTKECPICAEKKGILRELLKKRDELNKKLTSMHKTAFESEKKMCTMFTENDQRKTTSALSSLLPKARIVMPKVSVNDSSKI